MKPSSYIGGLVGQNQSTITNSYSTVTVNGSSFVGGLVGFNYNGTISNTYSTGTVNGLYDYIGGLVGRAQGSGSISISFWDTETSGQSTSGGSEVGKSTANMKTISTFSGWDFETVWGIDSSNNGYPHLGSPFGGGGGSGGSSVPEYSTYLLFITIGTCFYLLQNKFAKV